MTEMREKGGVYNNDLWNKYPIYAQIEKYENVCNQDVVTRATPTKGQCKHDGCKNPFQYSFENVVLTGPFCSDHRKLRKRHGMKNQYNPICQHRTDSIFMCHECNWGKHLLEAARMEAARVEAASTKKLIRKVKPESEKPESEFTFTCKGEFTITCKGFKELKISSKVNNIKSIE